MDRKHIPLVPPNISGLLLLSVVTGLLPHLHTANAQNASVDSTSSQASKEINSKIVTFTTQEDHRDMQKQLGITKLLPGPSGNPSDPNAANTDESNANPYPEPPDVMKLRHGDKVTAPDIWWEQRRPEIVEDFEREVLGRVPANPPSVTYDHSRETRRYVGPD